LDTSTTGAASFAPFPPAGALAPPAPPYATYLVTLALIESKVFLKCDGNCF